MTQCKNCSTAFEGKFCPDCGQKAKTGRITLGQVVKDLQNQVFHFEEGFLFTIRELVRRPGLMVAAYLAGKRAKHVKPIKFLVWTTAISFLFLHLIGFQELMLKQVKAQQQLQDNSSTMNSAVKINEWINAHPSLLMLFTVPFIALASWLLFRKKGYNYAEHFTGVAYLMGMLNVFAIFFTILYACFSHLPIDQLAMIGTVQWIFYLIFYGWACTQWFSAKKPFWVGVKGALVVLLGYVFLILVMSVLIATLLPLFKPQIEAWLAK
ncbi:MAG: DUF3667 domain-containing protein [Saprospiraceae bacterium]|nr:DUF3667 domain-containing protein [Saprospiraceae bacterium]